MNIKTAAACALWYRKTGREDIVFYKVNNGQWMSTYRENIPALFKRPISRFYEIDEILEQFGAK